MIFDEPHTPTVAHRLLVRAGERTEIQLLPLVGRALIGRAVDADVQIQHRSVSRRHAELVIDGDDVRLRDLDSRNGTRVNGARISDQHVLLRGDVISVGEGIIVFCGVNRTGGDQTLARRLPERFSSAGHRLSEWADGMMAVSDPSMVSLCRQIERLAATDFPVLIGGEDGTGKKLAAKALHRLSRRQGSALQVLDCAALPKDAGERALFNNVGDGTLLLANLDRLALPIQSQLARALETRRLARDGSGEEHPFGVRVLATTTRNLETGVEEGWFRSNLFYQVSVAVLSVPPLRRRPGEIPLLARWFMGKARTALHRPPISFSSSARQLLLVHDWPGNVRELEDLVVRLAQQTTGDIVDADQLAALSSGGEARSPTQPGSVDGRDATPVTAWSTPTLHESDHHQLMDLVRVVLLAAGGNSARAARLLGLSLNTFVELIRRHRI
jgi:DNA-binding NtrC family response regulator